MPHHIETPSGVGYGWRGMFSPQPTSVLGECCELFLRGPGRNQSLKHILAYREGHKTLFFTYMPML